MTKVYYYPEMGEVLPNDNVCVPTSRRTEDGEIRDGCVEIGPDNVNYATWSETARNKEQYLKAQREQRNDARRQRREASRAVRSGDASHDETS